MSDRRVRAEKWVDGPDKGPRCIGRRRGHGRAAGPSNKALKAAEEADKKKQIEFSLARAALAAKERAREKLQSHGSDEDEGKEDKDKGEGKEDNDNEKGKAESDEDIDSERCPLTPLSRAEAAGLLPAPEPVPPPISPPRPPPRVSHPPLLRPRRPLLTPPRSSSPRPLGRVSRGWLCFKTQRVVPPAPASWS